jgi:hypothetical protein
VHCFIVLFFLFARAMWHKNNKYETDIKLKKKTHTKYFMKKIKESKQHR